MKSALTFNLLCSEFNLSGEENRAGHEGCVTAGVTRGLSPAFEHLPPQASQPARGGGGPYPCRVRACRARECSCPCCRAEIPAERAAGSSAAGEGWAGSGDAWTTVRAVLGGQDVISRLDP